MDGSIVKQVMKTTPTTLSFKLSGMLSKVWIVFAVDSHFWIHKISKNNTILIPLFASFSRIVEARIFSEQSSTVSFRSFDSSLGSEIYRDSGLSSIVTMFCDNRSPARWKISRFSWLQFAGYARISTIQYRGTNRKLSFWIPFSFSNKWIQPLLSFKGTVNSLVFIRR